VGKGFEKTPFRVSLPFENRLDTHRMMAESLRVVGVPTFLSRSGVLRGPVNAERLASLSRRK
jgi:protein-disulfide isomerase